MSEYKHKLYNVSILLYHYVCTAKYRRVIFDNRVDKILINTCREIAKQYEINVLEIGTDGAHVHFLIKSVPSYAPKSIVKILKSIASKEIYRLYPEVNQKLWGGNIWSTGILLVQ